MAAYLAKAGINCVVFEHELFLRLHIGESLVPSSTHVFKDLDFLPQMEQNRFPHISTVACLGAKVYEGVAVSGVDFSSPERVAVKYSIGTKEFGASVRIVVDAGGRKTARG